MGSRDGGEEPVRWVDRGGRGRRLAFEAGEGDAADEVLLEVGLRFGMARLQEWGLQLTGAFCVPVSLSGHAVADARLSEDVSGIVG